MSDFENFVNLELPKRAPTLTLANTGYDNDPNLGGAPAAVQNSPQGTYFFRNTGNILYVKNTSSPATWAVVGSGGSSNALTKTTAAITLFISTTGSDANDGLSVGTPLLTLTAALNKLPYLIQFGHPAILNLAAGTYNEHVICPPFLLLDNITVVGPAMVLTAPGAGASSGTFDAVFGTQAFPHRALFTGAGWVAGGLTGGFFVEMLDGVNVGAQYPIVNNGVDTIDVAFPCNTGTLDLQGRLFRLVKPQVIFARSSANEVVIDLDAQILGQTVSGQPVSPTLSSYLLFSKIQFQRTSPFAQSLWRVSAGAFIRANNCSFLDAGGGGGTLVAVTGQSVVRFDDCLTFRSSLRTNTNHVSCTIASQFTGNRYGSYGGNFAINAATAANVLIQNGFFYGHDVAAACGSDTRMQLNSVGIDAPFGGAQVTDWGVLQLLSCTIRNCLNWGVAAGFQGFGGSFTTSPVSGGTVTITGSSGLGTVIDTCVLGVILGANCDCNISQPSAINNCTVAGVNLAGTLRSGHNVAVVNPLFTMSGNAADFLVDGATPTTLAFLRAQVPKAITSIDYFNRLVEV